MKPILVIAGAGGFGREMFDWAQQAAPPWAVRGFLDDNPAALAAFGAEVGVLGAPGSYVPEPGERVICAIGQLAAKRRVIDALRARGARFGKVVHASAVVGARAALGEGIILCPHAAVSSYARLGDFVTVNLHSTVAHDAVVGAYTQLHCHVDVTGGVVLGEGVLVGSHASILPGVRVGDRAVIGAGSVVTRDVAPGVTVYGVPARPMIANPGVSP